MSRKITIYAGVTNAAQVAITAKAIARGFRIQEDGSGSAAGLKITWPDGTVAEYAPAQQPIVVGDVLEGGMTPIIGVPAGAMNPSLPMPGGNTQPASPATQYCTVESMGANTAVQVTEYS